MGYYQEQPGMVTHSKSVIVIHKNTLYCAFCYALIGDLVGKVCFQMAGACDVQSYFNVHHHAKFEAGIYFLTPRENIAH